MKGWIKISDPADLERGLVRLLNRILASDNSIENAGRFANLSHAWIACRRLRLDSEEVKLLKERLDVIEKEVQTCSH